MVAALGVDGCSGRALVAYFWLGLWRGGGETGAWDALDVTRLEAHRAAYRRRGDDSLTHRFKRNEMKTVEIYTDGACKGNPGPGGWGALLRSPSGQEKELFGGELETTNNRMELMAVIEALRALKRPCQVALYLDSEYVRKGITEWIHGWKARNWRTAAKQPVKNADLWQQLDVLTHQGDHEIVWHWVKGHAGHVDNERADGLANRGVELVLSSR